MNGTCTSTECSVMCAEGSRVTQEHPAASASESAASISTRPRGVSQAPSGHRAMGSPVPVWLGAITTTVSVTAALDHSSPATGPENI